MGSRAAFSSRIAHANGHPRGVRGYQGHLRNSESIVFLEIQERLVRPG